MQAIVEALINADEKFSIDTLCIMAQYMYCPPPIIMYYNDNLRYIYLDEIYLPFDETFVKTNSLGEKTPSINWMSVINGNSMHLQAVGREMMMTNMDTFDSVSIRLGSMIRDVYAHDKYVLVSHVQSDSANRTAVLYETDYSSQIKKVSMKKLHINEKILYIYGGYIFVACNNNLLLYDLKFNPILTILVRGDIASMAMIDNVLTVQVRSIHVEDIEPNRQFIEYGDFLYLTLDLTTFKLYHEISDDEDLSDADRADDENLANEMLE
jgi:hypothetical protein